MKKYNLAFFLYAIFISFSIQANIFDHYKSSKEAAIKLAPETKITIDEWEQKKFNYFKHWSAFGPQVSLFAKKDKNLEFQQTLYTQALGLSADNYTAGIQYTLPLFSYDLINELSKSKLEKQLAKIDYTQRQNEFDAKFDAKYLEYLLAIYKLKTLETSLTKAITNKAEASLSFQLGQKTKVDVLRTEANAVALESKKILYLQSVSQKLRELINYTGHEVVAIDMTNLTESEIKMAIDQIANLTTTIEQNQFVNSPLIKSLKTQKRLNEKSLNQLTSFEWPKLELQGTLYRQSTTQNDLLSHGQKEHSFAITLSLPIFNSGTSVFSHFEEYHAKRKNQIEMDLKEKELLNNFEISFAKIKSTEKLLNSLRINVAQFEELSKLTQKSYELGKSTIFELLDIQDQLIESKVNLAETQINYFNMAREYIWQTGNQNE